MKRVELYARVRHAVMIDGLSQREAARWFGIDPRTVRKMLSYSVPPGYIRTRPRGTGTTCNTGFRTRNVDQFYAASVVHFYSGQWCTFTPALTRPKEPTLSDLGGDYRWPCS